MTPCEAVRCALCGRRVQVCCDTLTSACVQVPRVVASRPPPPRSPLVRILTYSSAGVGQYLPAWQRALLRPARCAVCSGTRSDQDGWLRCEDCGTPAHRACLNPSLTHGFAAGLYRCVRCLGFGLRQLQVGASGATIADGVLHELFSEGLHLESRALELSTATAYSGNRARLSRFCTEVLHLPEEAMFPLHPRSATPWELLYLWITYAARSLRPSTIDNYVKTIIDWHAQKGLASKCPHTHHRITRLRRGLVKSAGAGAVPRRKQALSWKWFLLLVHHIRHGQSPMIVDRRCALRDVLWLTGGFLALARRSELTAFRRCDLRILSDHIVFFFRSSKTDPGGIGALVRVATHSIPGLDLCSLASEYQQVLERAGVGPDGPLFGWDSDPGRAYACKGDGIVTRLRRLMAELDQLHSLGLGDVKEYAGHSLRRGGAQALRDVGVPREVIMAQGRWRSSAVDVYLDVLQPSWLIAATRALATRSWSATAVGRHR